MADDSGYAEDFSEEISSYDSETKLVCPKIDDLYIGEVCPIRSCHLPNRMLNFLRSRVTGKGLSLGTRSYGLIRPPVGLLWLIEGPDIPDCKATFGQLLTLPWLKPIEKDELYH